MGGGSKTEVITPQPQAAPSSGEAIREWVQAMPQVYETQMEYAPKEAQQQLELLQQYGAPMAEAYAEAQKQLQPETYALQEQLATKAGEAIGADQVPEAIQEQYRSQLAAGLGTNIGSPIGADYMSRALIDQAQQYQQRYENLGLSLAGRQPLAQPTAPQYSNYMSQFGPAQQLGYTQSTYGTQVAGSTPFLKPGEAGGWNLGILGRWDF